MTVPSDNRERPSDETRRLEHQVRVLQNALADLNNSLSSKRRRRQIDALWVYVLFIALISAGAYGIITASKSGATNRIKLLEEQVRQHEENKLSLNAELEAWKNVETNLMELDELIRSGQKEAAVDRFTQLRHLKFSGLLLHLVERFKKEVAAEKYRLGAEHYTSGSYRRADDAFQLSLRYESEPEYLGRLLYLRGMSVLRLKRFKEAGALLEQALNKGLNRRDRLQARFHRAYAYDRSGRRRMAREHYRLFEQYYPKHPYSQQAKMRYKALRRR